MDTIRPRGNAAKFFNLSQICSSKLFVCELFWTWPRSLHSPTSSFLLSPPSPSLSHLHRLCFGQTTTKPKTTADNTMYPATNWLVPVDWMFFCSRVKWIAGDVLTDKLSSAPPSCQSGIVTLLALWTGKECNAGHAPHRPRTEHKRVVWRREGGVQFTAVKVLRQFRPVPPVSARLSSPRKQRRRVKVGGLQLASVGRGREL